MPTRRLALAIVLLLLGALDAAARGYHVAKAPAGKPYSHVVTLRIGPFDVSATHDREVCQYVQLPYVKGLTSCQRERPEEPETCGLPILGYEIRLGGGISHHFILWAYEGTVDSAAKFPPGIHDSQACLDFGPADSLHTRQIGNSQSRRLRALLPEGLGQQIRAVTDAGGTPRAIGLVLNAHYIGAGKPTKGVARVKLFVARPGTIRAYGKLIFDVTGSAFIDVPPGTVKTTGGAWEVGGPSAPIVGGPPASDACVLFLSAHMHKRGVRFTTELVDASGARTIYDAGDWEHPGTVAFTPPRLMTRGMQFRYTCTHDNGVTTPLKLGCELETGVTPGVPLWKTFALREALDGAPRSCATDADCTGIGTGRCVPANLVFGFTSNDEMCILPGMYYDAIAGAPAGRECDLSLLPPL